MNINENETNLNLPVMSVEQTVDTLSGAYQAVVTAGLSPRVLPSVMLWGPPGVGKSQAVRQIARVLEESTGKRVVVTDVRLLLFNPIDLRGIPTANAEKTLAIWLKPQIFQMDDSPDTLNILFLDEISAAPQSVQAAAYQITLDRVVGEHKLPDNCIVMAAGNRVTDKSVAFKMPRALANRLLHIEVSGSFESWQRWAVKHGIHAKVLGFLSARTDRLFGKSTADELAFTTPRSWEMVSNLLNHVSDDENAMFPLISGLIGNGTAIEFRSWCRVYHEFPNMEDIFNGATLDVPCTTDALYALVSSMTSYAREHMDNDYLIGNSLRYAERLPADFGQLLISNYEGFSPSYKKKLQKLPQYLSYASRRGAFRNGSV